MRFTCSSCGKPIVVADEKVPAKPFTVSCPACKTRQTLQPPTPAATPAVPAAPPAAPVAARSKAPATEELPALRDADSALLAALEREAYLVELSSRPDDAAVAALKSLGTDRVQRFENVEAAIQAHAETPAGILLIRFDKLSAPPVAELAPLATIPPNIRRHTFVAVEAENVRSLDGQVAFLLQVNCLLASGDAAQMPLLLRRAVLHHLRLYRHWDAAMAG